MSKHQAPQSSGRAGTVWVWLCVPAIIVGALLFALAGGKPVALLPLPTSHSMPVRRIQTVSEYTNLTFPKTAAAIGGEEYVTFSSGRFLVAEVDIGTEDLPEFLHQTPLNGTLTSNATTVSRFLSALPPDTMQRWKLDKIKSPQVAGGAFAESPGVGVLIDESHHRRVRLFVWSVN